MIDKLQCQTHTRHPWGQNPHRYDPRLRFLVMGLLCASVLAVFIASLVLIGIQAIKAYQLTPSDAGPATVVAGPSVVSNNITTKTNATANNSPYNNNNKTGSVT